MTRDPLSPARGCLFGIVLGVLLWVLGAAVVVCAVTDCLQ